MSLTSERTCNITSIKISGRFDFNLSNDFRQTYEGAPAGSEFIIDLAHAEYIDSSALGILILLRAHAGGENSKIKIINCNAGIKKVLLGSQFQTMFEIS
jgi:HptB-dependent secretion and biofilm anti anti-sigma factor